MPPFSKCAMVIKRLLWLADWVVGPWYLQIMAGADSPCGHCERHSNHHCDHYCNKYCEHHLNYQLDYFDHHLDAHRDLAILFGKPEGKISEFWALWPPPTKISYTTPHYYPEYEIWEIHFFVKKSFKGSEQKNFSSNYGVFLLIESHISQSPF